MNRSNADIFTLLAPAKINLYLHVTGKRADGYHLLDSLAVFARDIADRLTFEPANDFSLTITGPFKQSLDANDPLNLVTRAAQNHTCKITLEKNIPLGAGLGGGSSDAAATIKGLEKIHGPLTDRTEKLLALGADVPVCYESTPSRFQGIGEQITPAPPLPACYLLLIWPNAHSATKDVFAGLNGTFTPPAKNFPEKFNDLSHLIEFLKTTNNDLTDAAERLSPEIKTARLLLETQEGCLLARMSGSGASVFGIFKTSDLCNHAKQTCSAQNPGWWIQTTTI